MGRLQQFVGDVDSSIRVVGRTAGDEALNRVVKDGSRRVAGLTEEISWYVEVISVDFHSGRVAVFFGSCAKAEHDPGQLGIPAFG